MPSFAAKLAKYLKGKIPVDRVTVYRDRSAPQLHIETMDVDRVQSIIEGAIDGDTRELFALYRDIILSDSHIQNEFGKRKLAVLGDQLSIHPKDKKLPEDVTAADQIRAMVEGCASWRDANVRILD